MTTHEENTENINDIQLGYQLTNMELIDFEIRSKRTFEENSLGFQIAITHNISPDGTVKVDAKVNIIAKEDVLSSTNIVCTYRLENYQEWIVVNNFQSGELPTEFANLINGITISTLRGVMFMKLQDTFLEKVVLPVIDLNIFRS
jgi:hypothetical protein